MTVPVEPASVPAPAPVVQPVPPLLPRERIGRRLMCAGALVMATGLGMSLVLMHVGLGIAFAGVLLARPALHRMPGFWWACAYAGWEFITMAVSAASGGESLLVRGYGEAYVWIAMFIAAEVFRDAWMRTWAVLAMSVVSVISLGLSLAQFAIGFGGTAPFRVWSGGVHGASAGFFPIHLTQGFIMTQILLVAWTQPLAAGGWRFVHWGGRLAPLVCIVLTGGRTGVLALLAGWSLWFASTGRRLLIGAGLAVVGLVLATAWLAWVRPSAVDNVRKFDDARTTHWLVACVLIKEHPLFGVGGAQDFKRENNRVIAAIYPDGSHDSRLNAPDAHNSFLGIASEHGIPALVFYLGILAAVLRHLWRVRAEQPWAWRLGAGLVASAVVAGQVEHLAGHSTTCYGLFLLLGFALALTLPPRGPALAEVRTSV